MSVKVQVNEQKKRLDGEIARLKEQLLASYEAQALLYEQNLQLMDQGLAAMEAIAELYEMTIPGGV